MKDNILFVSEKFCHCNINTGWTSNLEDLVYTLQQSYPNYNINTIHSDEAILVFRTHLDDILVDYCIDNKIKIILFSFIDGGDFNPSLKTLEKLKKLKIYMAAFWLDTYTNSTKNLIEKLKNFINLNISIDNPSYNGENNQELDNHIFLWPARNKQFFYKQKQDIPISFIGSPNYNDRGYYLNNLVKEYPNLNVKGGRIDENLSSYQYAELIRRSKINLNFGLSPQKFYQTKGRSFEVFASGSMLLESKNPSLEKLFKRNIDYIDFSTPQELSDKVRYYLNNDNERLKIAQNGYKKFQKLYTSHVFWNTIIKRIENELSNPNLR